MCLNTLQKTQRMMKLHPEKMNNDTGGERRGSQPESQPSALFTQVPQLLRVDTVEINHKSRTNEEIV